MVLPTVRYLLLFLFFLGLSGCAGTAGRYLPVYTNKPRISTLGFAVLPPPGPGWYEKISKDSLFYFKKTQSETYAIATKATELHFSGPFPDKESFYHFTKSRKTIGGDATLVKSVDVSVTPSERSDRCLRYRQVYEDYRAENAIAVATARPTTVTNTGLICIHPDNERVGIDLFYQERRTPTPGTPEPSFAREGEAFLNNLSFLSLEARR